MPVVWSADDVVLAFFSYRRWCLFFLKKKKVPWSYIMSLGQGMIIVCTVMLTMAYLTLFPFPLSLFLGKRKIDMFFQLGLG